jgi:cell division protein FtsB
MDSELLKQLAELNDKYLEVKAENETLKAKITKIRNELLASKLCNDFEVDRIFAENKAHWNNDLSESLTHKKR